MANTQAIAAVTSAITDLLRSSYQPARFNGVAAEFEPYTSTDFQNPMQTGVSCFLYRVFFHGSSRTPAGRLTADGRRKTTLPLELHLLLTVWSPDAIFQQRLAGWMMRVLEDHPLLPAGLLNARMPGAFRPDETVEITIAELSTEDLLRIWETLDTAVFQLSIPYLVRVLAIESVQTEGEGVPSVAERVQSFGRLPGDDEAPGASP